MKRKNVTVLGNMLMGFGMILMIGGIGFSIASQFPKLNVPEYMTYIDLVGIFLAQYFG